MNILFSLMLLIILAFKIILIKSYAVVKSYVDANFMMNNGGGPFESIGDCGHPNNTKLLECNVLDYYASLWHAKWPHNESYWGYLLNMGSTEGNIHTIWSAQSYLCGCHITLRFDYWK